MNESNGRKNNNYSNASTSRNENKKGMSFSVNGKPINNTMIKFMLFLIVFLVIVIGFVIIGAITWLFVKFVLPVLLVVSLIGIIKGIFFHKK